MRVAAFSRRCISRETALSYTSYTLKNQSSCVICYKLLGRFCLWDYHLQNNYTIYHWGWEKNVVASFVFLSLTIIIQEWNALRHAALNCKWFNSSLCKLYDYCRGYREINGIMTCIFWEKSSMLYLNDFILFHFICVVVTDKRANRYVHIKTRLTIWVI